MNCVVGTLYLEGLIDQQGFVEISDLCNQAQLGIRNQVIDKELGYTYSMGFISTKEMIDYYESRISEWEIGTARPIILRKHLSVCLRLSERQYVVIESQIGVVHSIDYLDKVYTSSEGFGLWVWLKGVPSETIRNLNNLNEPRKHIRIKLLRHVSSKINYSRSSALNTDVKRSSTENLASVPEILFTESAEQVVEEAIQEKKSKCE